MANPTELFATIFQQNWENVRSIKSERIWFMNTYSVISAGSLSLLQGMHGERAIQLTLILALCLLSVMGLISSLRLKAELEECLDKIQMMVGVHASTSSWPSGGRRASCCAIRRSDGCSRSSTCPGPRCSSDCWSISSHREDSDEAARSRPAGPEPGDMSTEQNPAAESATGSLEAADISRDIRERRLEAETTSRSPRTGTASLGHGENQPPSAMWGPHHRGLRFHIAWAAGRKPPECAAFFAAPPRVLRRDR